MQASTIPGRKGRFIEATTDYNFKELFFKSEIESLGLSSQESLLAINFKGTLLIPLQNFRTECVDVEVGTQVGSVEILERKPIEPKVNL